MTVRLDFSFQGNEKVNWGIIKDVISTGVPKHRDEVEKSQKDLRLLFRVKSENKKALPIGRAIYIRILYYSHTSSGFFIFRTTFIIQPSVTIPNTNIIIKTANNSAWIADSS